MIPTLYRLYATNPTANVNCPSDTTTTGGSNSCETGLPKVDASSTQVHNVLQLFFGIAGAISVLMIVIGGMMFVTSGGDPEKAKKARETILYAVIGLAVSVSAELIITFVIGRLS